MRHILLGSVALTLVLACSAAGTDPLNIESSQSALSSGGVPTPVALGGVSIALTPSKFAAGTADSGTCTPTMRINSPPGLVIPSATLSHVFWGGYWSAAGATEKKTYDTTWTDVGNNPAFYARLAEYSTSTLAITTGTWTGSTLTNASLASGTTLTEDQIQQELKAEIATGTVPARTNSRIYLVMLPPGVTSTFDAQNSFAGHHRSFADASGNPVYYAVITYNPDPNYNNPLLSHEISEAITDPDLSTGWLDTSGNEIGDICRGQYATLDGFTIETIWSMKSCACVGTGTTSTSPIANGDFEASTLVGWTATGSTAVASTAHGGVAAAIVGSRSPTNGDSAIAQTFTAPATGGTLSFWYAVTCPDQVQFDWATATLKDNTAATTTTPLAKTCTSTGKWTQVTSALVAGHSYTLKLMSHDDNYAGDPTFTLYDDVTVSSSPPPPPQVVINGTFETATLTGWTAAGAASITTTAHSGSDAAVVGLVGQVTNGDSSITQSFTAPATASSLTFFYRVVCKDSLQYDWATATLKDTTTGATTTPLAKTCSNTGAWTQVTAPLTAGHAYTLKLVSHDDNHAADETYTYFDDVAVK